MAARRERISASDEVFAEAPLLRPPPLVLRPPPPPLPPPPPPPLSPSFFGCFCFLVEFCAVGASAELLLLFFPGEEVEFFRGDD